MNGHNKFGYVGNDVMMTMTMLIDDGSDDEEKERE